jgi:hypothetical protein
MNKCFGITFNFFFLNDDLGTLSSESGSCIKKSFEDLAWWFSGLTSNWPEANYAYMRSLSLATSPPLDSKFCVGFSALEVGSIKWKSDWLILLF